jgi:hypothetical protein
MKLQKTIVLLLAGTAMTTATALAQQVGTATAVNPETRTTPPGGATVVLKVGARHAQGTHQDYADWVCSAPIS